MQWISNTENDVASKRPNMASKMPEDAEGQRHSSATQCPTTQPSLARRRGRSGRGCGEEHGPQEAEHGQH